MNKYKHIYTLVLAFCMLQSAYSQEQLSQGDTLMTANDAVELESLQDSTHKKSSIIDSPIAYDSVDSMSVSLENGQQIFHLYGDATIEYGEIKLEADYISVNFEEKEISATGLIDSLGEITGKPHFIEGSEEFDCESMRYNFVTGKGFTQNVVTEQQDGIVRSAKTKMMSKDVYCMVDGKYSTCDAEHPHFYLEMTKGKMIRNKAIITGRSYLVLEDFPIYFPFLPYGYIPTNSQTYSSGIIVPSYGEETLYGFYLKDGGFYWAANDYFDLKLTGDIYSKGKWGLNVDTKYKLRYKFSGSFSFSYTRSVTGERGIDQSVSPNFSLQWSHSQDSKANPSRTISASVNFSSSGYDKENEYDDTELFVTNTKSSSVSYRKTFQNTPFSLSANLRSSQNSSTSSVSLSLPTMTFNMSSIQPFKRKNSVGEKRFYEDFKLSYSAQIQNSLTTTEDELFSTPFSEWKKGIKHSIPLTLPSMTLLKNINVVPSISYTERWYFDYLEEYWLDGYSVTDNETGLQKWVPGHVEEVKKDGFKRNYEYSYSLSTSTTLYGLFTMRNPNSKIKAIRHKIVPSIGFSYHPDFGEERFGFYDWVQSDSLGNYEQYDIFDDGVYGSTSKGKSGSISFGLSNNIEMKMLNEGDTTSTDLYKKVAIFDNLGFSGSYNLAADSMNLSTFSLSARTKIAGTSVNVAGTLDPYALSSKGTRVNEFMWNNASGISKLGRLTRVSTGFSFGFDSEKIRKKAEEKRKTNGLGGVGDGQEQGLGQGGGEQQPLLASTYTKYSMPTSVNFNYSFSYTNSRGTPVWSQTVGMSGSIAFTPKWKTTFSSGFDFVAKELTYTNMSIVRDLHCWTMSFAFSPISSRSYYTFSIKANASMLSSLKIDKTAYDY